MSIYLSKESCATIHWFNIYGSITHHCCRAEIKLSKTHGLNLWEVKSMRINQNNNNNKIKSLKLWLIPSRTKGEWRWSTEGIWKRSLETDTPIKVLLKMLRRRPKAERGAGFERVASYTEVYMCRSLRKEHGWKTWGSDPKLLLEQIMGEADGKWDWVVNVQMSLNLIGHV